MLKFKKSSELLWIFGNIFVALGVSICSKANLGVSMIAAPAFVVSEALSKIFAFLSVGVTEYIIQGILLIGLCLIIRKFNWRYLFAFAVAVIYGYTLNVFLWLFSGIEFNGVIIRWVMLIVGDVCTAFGVACFFHTYMPLQVYELFVVEVAHKLKIEINKVKWIFDISLLVISIICAFTLFGDATSFDWSKIGYTSFHSIGLGTVVTTIINSPIIKFMSKLIERFFEDTPRFSKLYTFLKRK
ncbi:MAG: DUF6198 family protein [Oscillospiraceae bacterium]|nr:DUF6198 family protein [Oscillospiraceae bacterium]